MPNLSPEIIAAAKSAETAWKVPASVTLAQYGLESAWGKDVTGINNYFGIKAMNGLTSTLCWTHEYVGGRYIRTQQPFANFPTVAAAFTEHAKLIATHPIYAPAMAALPNLQQFVSLMAAHYATAPNYAAQIMDIINGDNLTQYD